MTVKVDRRSILKTAGGLGLAAQASLNAAEPMADRLYWWSLASRLAEPVLSNLARGSLRRTMPVEATGTNVADRRRYTHLEAVARLLSGIAPWFEVKLEPGPERDAQQRLTAMTREALAVATDPSSPDYLNFSEGAQPVVDCGFLAQALLRAPNELWGKLPKGVQRKLADALTSSRVVTPPYNNWLMFCATVEAALAMMGERWDGMRVDYALRKHQEWYLGDGVYGDGPHFHWDYYNSYVIHPMLVDVLRAITAHSPRWKDMLPPVLSRARRYAAIQERLIGVDGAFPAIGRSIAYRCGAFHLLAQIALLRELPAGLTGAQVRCAMTAMIRKVMEAPGTFDAGGWLQIGLCGHQPHLGESYISTGSLYLCSAALLPLGLPAADPFWADPAAEWTSRRIWTGQDLAADHAI